MKRYLMVLAFVLGALPVQAQSLKIPMSVFLVGAGLDDASTAVFLTQKTLSEDNPLLKWAHNDPVKIPVVAVLTDALTVAVAHHYVGGHPKLVKTALYALGGVRLFFGVRNIKRMHYAQ